MILSVIAVLLQATDPAMPKPPEGTFGLIGAGLAAAGYGAYWIWTKFFQKDAVGDAGKALDITVLSAGGEMITRLQGDIQRLRDQQSANEKKWQEDMQRLQDRLNLMANQVEEAINARRLAEEKVAQLRLQVISLNGQPVA